jgi:organic radical activating enzyme
MRTVRLIEFFNYTWQGEAEDAGKKMLLLRFKHCNRAHGYLVNNGLKACTFCDTIVKMNVIQEAEYSIKDIQAAIEANNLAVMITGGEPSFGINLQSTIDIINLTKSYLYNIETNGCELEKLIGGVNKNKNVKYMLSPKLFTENDYTFYEKLIPKIKDNEKVIIKLVYEHTILVIKFLDFLQKINFDTNRIWLMPEGKTRDELIRNAPDVFNAAEKYKTNFSSRNHVVFEFI